MVKYIERAAVETMLENAQIITDGEYCGYCMEDINLGSIPTADVVEVVRCRECKHYHAGTGWCDQLSYFQTSDGEPCSPAESMDWKMFQENDFCSHGKRKEPAHEPQ